MMELRRPGMALALACTLSAIETSLSVALAAAPAQMTVHSLDDLPRYSYPYRGSVALLFTDEAQLKPLVDRVKADTLATLEKYAIDDRATKRSLHQTLLDIAVLQNDSAAIRRETAEAVALSDKDLDRRYRGQVELAYADGLDAGSPGSPTFKAAFAKSYADRLNALPWALVGANVKQRTGMNAIVTPALVIGSTAEEVQPGIDKGGAVSSDKAPDLIGAIEFAKALLPLKAEMLRAESAYIAANDKEKPDIWAARAMTLPDASKLTPVVVAIWDSGVDMTLFPKQAWTNSKETINGLDDDGDGHIDDVHGIAVDEYGKPSTSLMIPVPADIAPRLARARSFSQGLDDQQNGFSTPDSKALADYFAKASPADGRQFIADLEFFGEYGHATHVAGIVADGNPAVRLVSIRHTFAFQQPPRRPTEETATAFARSYPDAIAYMRKAGVRVVNMSWTVGLKDEYEDQLAANGVPAPQRTQEARRLFAIEANALRTAIESAPDILFICAAGNSNDSAAFSGNVPSSIDAPNVITVAAVDQAGDPTSFTSSGPSVDIAADGYRVESFVPGGTRQRWSGTSMASPGVVNAAAKLWAVDPNLTVAQMRELLLSTSTKQGEFRLLDPKAALAQLEAQRH